MKKQRRTVGSIVEIDLEDGFFTYAQILSGGSAFFDFRTDKRLKSTENLANAKVLFIIRVYDDAFTNGRWIKVGKLPIREEFKVLPMKFIQDELNPGKLDLYNPNTGEITPATRKECKELECAAVWEAEHVEDRLRDYYNGVPNKWVQQLALK